MNLTDNAINHAQPPSAELLCRKDVFLIAIRDRGPASLMS